MGTTERAKVANCPICKGWKMVDCSDDVDTDKNSLKEFTRYAKMGCIIDYVPTSSIRNGLHPICECKKKQITLFQQ